MRKKILSVLSIMTIGQSAIAGGDIALAPVLETVPSSDNSFLYVGFGFGYESMKNAFTKEEISDNTVVLQAGYRFNTYLAIEGRVSKGFNTDYDYGILSPREYSGDYYDWGMYVKLMYPIGDLSVYALLGYGGITQKSLDSGDAYDSDFRWGLGASYALTEQINIFADYISLYDDVGFDYRAKDRDIDSDTWTFGLSYRF